MRRSPGRVLLKLSGEAFKGPEGALSASALERITQEIAPVDDVQLAIVVGGGNIIRGVSAHEQGIDRITGDSMGMLATVINALALSSAIEQLGVQTRVQTAIHMAQVAEPYIRRRAIRHLEKGRVVVFAAGTGNPFFTTDSASSLRAIEIEADIMLKATKVDGVYTADPVKDKTATRFDHLTFDEALKRKVGVMDATALVLCNEHRMPVRVFNIFESGHLGRIVAGESLGTLVEQEAAV